MGAITLNLDGIINLTKDKFLDLCRANSETKLELNAQGELVIMSPTGGESGYRNSELNASLVYWNRQNKLGKVFDSSTMFELPNGAFRSPDVAWIALERWNALSPSQRETFPPIVPDFVIELRSASDTLKSLQQKMAEYRENGVSLGWLIDPKNQRVEIYHPNQETEVLLNHRELSGEEILPGFILDLKEIF